MRTFAQALFESPHFGGSTLHQSLDPTVGQISDPTAAVHFFGYSASEGAKAHALNSARNEVVFGESSDCHGNKLGGTRYFEKDFMPSDNAKRAPLASMIDHTLLKPEATRAQIEKLCAEAKQYRFATVCVQPFRVAVCAELLKGSQVKVCTVIGFPLGANRAEVKALETVRACADGAGEFDMVMNIGALKDGNLAAVENDIASVIKAAQGRTVKVILETALLSDEEIKSACAVCIIAGADFVKTSTGFGPGGATVHHVKLMKETVGDQLEVKASGGIRDRETMIAMIEAGATRIGTSNGAGMVSDKGDY